MTNNDILISIRYLMNVKDETIVEIIAMGGGDVVREDVHAYLKREEDEGFTACSHKTMAQFLNGLVIYKRGKDESRPLQALETPVTNNTVLKKLRVAFELKDTDVIALIEKQGTLKISKTELTSFFRARDHRNYRECGDQYLRNLFKALSL